MRKNFVGEIILRSHDKQKNTRTIIMVSEIENYNQDYQYVTTGKEFFHHDKFLPKSMFQDSYLCLGNVLETLFEFSELTKRCRLWKLEILFISIAQCFSLRPPKDVEIWTLTSVYSTCRWTQKRARNEIHHCVSTCSLFLKRKRKTRSN